MALPAEVPVKDNEAVEPDSVRHVLDGVGVHFGGHEQRHFVHQLSRLVGGQYPG